MEAIRPILRECYDFIADVIFEKQFTGQEYIDGMDARELLKITAQLLGSVTSGYDAIYSEQKKVTELLYHPHFKYTPLISRSRTKKFAS